MIKKLALTFFLFPTMAVMAATPENGWWWNPAEPGTGYNIESQNGTMFVATFVYDGEGNPVWYSGSGQVNRNNVVTINLLRSEGGQCLGCGHTPAQSHDSGYQITLSFSDDGHGIVSLNGIETPIERFNFKFGHGVEKLLGVWMVSVLTPVTNGFGLSDVIAYTGIRDGIAVGTRAFNSSNISAAAAIDDNMFVMVTPISNIEKIVSVFRLSGLNNIIGLTTVVDIDASAQFAVQKIQNDGVLFVGFRAASTSDISGTASRKSSRPQNTEFDMARVQHEVEEIAAAVDDNMRSEIMRIRQDEIR